MADAATMAGSGLTLGKSSDRPRGGHRTLRSELAHVYAETFDRTARRDTLDGLEAVMRWLRRCERHQGPTLFRSMPQAFRGIGWPTSGHVRADRQAHRNRLANWLDMLQEMDVVESWEPHYKANGEGRGILIALRRDSSVGGAILALASARRPPRRPGPPSPPVQGEGPRRRPSVSTRLSPPLREKSPRNGYKLCVVVGKGQSRDARERRRLSGSAQITGYVARHLSEAGQDGGAEHLQAAPWLAEVPVSALLRAVVLAFAPKPGSGWAKHWSVRLSPTSQRQAEHAVQLLDRYDGRGAGAAAIIDLAAGGWRIHTPSGRLPRFPEPRTPGLLVKGLRKRARMAREVARFRSDYAASAGGSS